jgi:hypothetical protein
MVKMAADKTMKPSASADLTKSNNLNETLSDKQISSPRGFDKID